MSRRARAPRASAAPRRPTAAAHPTISMTPMEVDERIGPPGAVVTKRGQLGGVVDELARADTDEHDRRDHADPVAPPRADERRAWSDRRHHEWPTVRPAPAGKGSRKSRPGRPLRPILGQSENEQCSASRALQARPSMGTRPHVRYLDGELASRARRSHATPHRTMPGVPRRPAQPDAHARAAARAGAARPRRGPRHRAAVSGGCTSRAAIEAVRTLNVVNPRRVKPDMNETHPKTTSARVEKRRARVARGAQPGQYDVLRRKGTGAAVHRTLRVKKHDGTYRCAACGTALFSSRRSSSPARLA